MVGVHTWLSHNITVMRTQCPILLKLVDTKPHLQSAVTSFINRGSQGFMVHKPPKSEDIEKLVKSCSSCQLNQSAPPVVPLRLWSWPTHPWARLHIDYAGPVEGKMILVLIDAHFKWIEAVCTAGSTSAVVIEELRAIFACFGIPETLVSDNGTCFVSKEFESLLKANGVRHLTI